ncbi:tRNA pseudouridine synthase A-like [Capsicum annuum]|uniref:tRNA pseudouridine synthase A-like n=1 Tax=Capsicum annuum TaxID=4072 RepID=UPI001FB1914E|nr:tRNA pseudouridine synthase A-like [Capsicum annuum]
MGKHFYDPKIKSVIFVDAPTSEGNMVIENGDFLSKKVKKRNDESPKVVEERVQESVFIYGEKEKERFNQILKYYEGTHNFHNFTRRKKDGDPVAKRYILSFNANIIVNVQGIEFMKCEVTGQNFMLHTIHKMIGLAESIMRNYAPESLIITAFQRDVNIKFPMAPEVGLYLDECFFTSYNSKWKDTQEEVSLTAYLEMAEEFKMKHIYSHIAIMEHKEGTMGVWLHYLNHQNYPDLRVVDLVKPADDGLEVVETAIDVGLGVFNNCERTNNVNSTGASDGPDITKTIMEAGLSAANNGERIDNIDSAGAILEVTETIVQADLGSINNGESTNNVSSTGVSDVS